MNDGTTSAGYIPFTPIEVSTPMENEPMTDDHKLYHPSTDPSNWNETEMREFFAKVASAVVNASELAKVIEAIRAQQVEDHARLHNLETLVSTHLQTIDALREAVRETAERRDDALRDYAEANAERITLRNERDVARDTVAKLESEIASKQNHVNELATMCNNRDVRIHELESSAKGAQQTISDLQHTVYNLREEVRDAREVSANYKTECEAKAGLIDHYETQLDQVRKAIA